VAEKKINVKLLSMTSNPVSVVYAACKQCYSAKFSGDIYSKSIDGTVSQEKQEDFVRRIVASGHESPLEHVNFTFAIEGVSRVLTHQLVRHRLASYSQQSQRYVKEDDFDYIIPPLVKKHDELKDYFMEHMRSTQELYTKMINFLKKQGLEGEQANQDVRFLLPGACETKIVVTMNARELIHFFKVRCCTRAQWEISKLAYKMLHIVQEKLPSIFGDRSTKCDWLGYCPEGEKFSCGRYPIKE